MHGDRGIACVPKFTASSIIQEVKDGKQFADVSRIFFIFFGGLGDVKHDFNVGAAAEERRRKRFYESPN